MSSSARWSNSRQAGIGLIELLVAMAVFSILLVLVMSAFSTGLGAKSRQNSYMQVQQNLRTALQQVAQDLRASADMHMWHTPTGACSQLDTVCSGANEITIVALNGSRTTIPERPGSALGNSANTWVCDARSFEEGDVMLIYNGGASQLMEVSKVTPGRDYSKPCRGPSSGGSVNQDKLQHNKAKASVLGTSWQADSYVFNVELANYSLQPDPLDPSQTVLYRRNGLSSVNERTGIMAFDVSGLELSYGVPFDPSSQTFSQLLFYDSLEAAASALGGTYTADPSALASDPNALYVGNAVMAVRVTLTGTTPPNTRNPQRSFTLSETVDLRRDNSR